MGWKTSAILFDGHPASDRALLEALGYTNVVERGRVRVHEAFYPDGLFVGRFGGLTLLFDDVLPLEVAADPTAYEATIAKLGFGRVLVVTRYEAARGDDAPPEASRGFGSWLKALARKVLGG